MSAEQLEQSGIAARQQMREQSKARRRRRGASSSCRVPRRGATTAPHERLELLVEHEDRRELAQRGRHALPVRRQSGLQSD